MDVVERQPASQLYNQIFIVNLRPDLIQMPY